MAKTKTILGIVKLNRPRMIRSVIGAGDIAPAQGDQVSPGAAFGIVAGIGLLGLLIVLGVTVGAVWILYKAAKAIF